MTWNQISCHGTDLSENLIFICKTSSCRHNGSLLHVTWLCVQLLFIKFLHATKCCKVSHNMCHWGHSDYDLVGRVRPLITQWHTKHKHSCSYFQRRAQWWKWWPGHCRRLTAQCGLRTVDQTQHFPHSLISTLQVKLNVCHVWSSVLYFVQS